MRSVLLAVFLTALVLIPLGRNFGQPTDTLLWVLPLGLLGVWLSRQGRKVFTVAVLLIGVLVSQWAILHFSFQRDLNLQQLGEEQVHSERTGVAKFASAPSDEKLTRAYGVFGHPNILGGSLVLITLGAIAFFTQNKVAMSTVTIILFTGLILSFSRLAWISLAFGYASLSIVNSDSWPRSRAVLLPMAVTLFVLSPLMLWRVTDGDSRSGVERYRGYEFARAIIADNGLLQGEGVGDYTVSLREYLHRENIVHEEWERGPVHSVPLLAIAEWGALSALLIAAVGFAFVLIMKWWGVAFGVVVTAPLWALDHYLLTDAGGLLWWLVGLLFAQQFHDQMRNHRQALPAPLAE